MFPSFYNKLQLVDALFAQTQTSFGIGAVECTACSMSVQYSQWRNWWGAEG